jgi:putative flippase GtrA
MDSKLKLIRKWLRFNAIGTMGVGVQLLLLFLLTRLFHIHYMIATLLAVQCAIIHNFFWHQRWTWKENATQTKMDAVRRFVKFNTSSGTVSLVGNVGVTAALMQVVHLPLMICNILAIGACNIANFLFANNLVFHSIDRA